MSEEISEQVLEATKEKVNQEQREHPGFNNWYVKLPGSYQRRFLTDHNVPELDQKVIDWEPKEKDTHSDLLRHQTLREFYATVDQAIEDSGVDIERVKELGNLLFPQSQSDASTSKLDLILELEELVMPTYIRLRAMGYTAYDLAI